MIQPAQLSFNIRSGSGGDVYFAGSWHPGNEEAIAFHVVKALDKANFRAIGDIDERYNFRMEDDRIKRIMSKCSGFVGVLPNRPGDLTTSKYIVREMQLAAEMQLPMIIFYEPSVRVKLQSRDNETYLVFYGTQDLLEIPMPTTLFGPLSLDADPRIIDQTISLQLQGFIEYCRYETSKQQPFAFFITRLKDDFAQVQAAVDSVVHNVAGITCIWADDGKYGSTIQNVQSNIIELIRNAEFVIADLSFSDENPWQDNPNRAHEIGIARAFGKTIYLCSHGEKRSPYFSVRDMQVSFWKNELELENIFKNWLENNIRELGRQVYNWKLSSKTDSYKTSILPKIFVFDASKGYTFYQKK